jgi:tRNA/tmRNA/rRNA uracil-C5-methylase (TrmA/RlmC/RlmD family)
VLARRGDGLATLVSGPATVVEWAAGRRWRLPPTAFWQVHPAAADTLAAAVVQLLAPRPGDRIWDLYGGAGLFAAALAAEVGAEGRVTVVEGDPAAVAAARENLRDLGSVTIVSSDVARALRGTGGFVDRSGSAARRPGPARADAPRPGAPGTGEPRTGAAAGGEGELGGVDLVVLDPPRSGAGREVVALVAGRGPRAIAYVACDPAALARDVRTLRSCGYELTALRAFDLFPHTHHLETVALLTPA